MLVAGGAAVDMTVIGVGIITDPVTGTDTLTLNDAPIPTAIGGANVLEKGTFQLQSQSTASKVGTGNKLGNYFGKALPFVPVVTGLLRLRAESENRASQAQYLQVLSGRLEQKTAQVHEIREALEQLREINLGNPRYSYPRPD